MYPVFCHLSKEDAKKEAEGVLKDTSRVKNVTVCRIKNDNGDVISKGLSVCVDSDNFNKTTGRKLSLKNALAELKDVSKEDRKKIFSKAFPSIPQN